MILLTHLALAQLNIPYVWGGDNPMIGFDCSGLVQYLLSSVGEDPPGDQSAQGLFDHFRNTGTWNTYKAGALVFYGESIVKIIHVGMLLDEYRMIEAAGGGSQVTNQGEAAKCGACVKISLIDRRKDKVAVIRPRYTKIGQL